MSKYTGKFIFEQIAKLKQEVEELDTAIESLGDYPVAKKLLKRSYDEKNRELNKACSCIYQLEESDDLF